MPTHGSFRRIGPHQAQNCQAQNIHSIRAEAWQNQQNDQCTQQRQISLGICPVWSESSLCALWVILLVFLFSQLIYLLAVWGVDWTVITVFPFSRSSSTGLSRIMGTGILLILRRDIVFLLKNMKIEIQNYKSGEKKKFLFFSGMRGGSKELVKMATKNTTFHTVRLYYLLQYFKQLFALVSKF